MQQFRELEKTENKKIEFKGIKIGANTLLQLQEMFALTFDKLNFLELSEDSSKFIFTQVLLEKESSMQGWGLVTKKQTTELISASLKNNSRFHGCLESDCLDSIQRVTKELKDKKTSFDLILSGQAKSLKSLLSYVYLALHNLNQGRCLF